MVPAKPGRLSSAKALILATQLASISDVASLRILLTQNPIQRDTVLRILLSYLPETLDTSEYVPLLEEIISGIWLEEAPSKPPIHSSSLDWLSEDDAKRKARKLHLLPLKPPSAPSDIPEDPLVLFLIHRSLRIDEYTGILTQIPELLAPFLHHSPYLRTWLISTVLPLVRLNYDYHPGETAIISVPKFDSLNERAAVSLLLSRTGTSETDFTNTTVGRDLRGLVGPWMYGESRWKKISSDLTNKSVTPLDEDVTDYNKYSGWEEVFIWITEHASHSWDVAVKVVEQWEGPGDVDTGGYGDGSRWASEDDQQHLEVRYARSILAAAYLITDTSVEALNGVDRLISRLITLMDQEKLPTLQQAAAMLLPVPDFGNLLKPSYAASLRNDLLEETNPLTKPKQSSIQLIHTLVVSAFLCTRSGTPVNMRKAGELALLQDKADQKAEFLKLMSRVGEHAKQDEKYWQRTRNEILWLRNWGVEQIETGSSTSHGCGIFGKLPSEMLERKVLEGLLGGSCRSLHL